MKEKIFRSFGSINSNPFTFQLEKTFLVEIIFSFRNLWICYFWLFQAVFVFVMMGIGATRFNNYIFPHWADMLGWSIGACTLIPFPIFIIYNLIRGKVCSVLSSCDVWNCLMILFCPQSFSDLFKTAPEWISQEERNLRKLDAHRAPSKIEGVDNIAYENSWTKSSHKLCMNHLKIIVI